MKRFSIRKFFGFLLSLLMVAICFWIVIYQNNGIEILKLADQQHQNSSSPSQSTQEDVSLKEDTTSTKEIESYSNAVDEFEQEREKERILYEAIRPNGSNIVNISSELHDPLLYRSVSACSNVCICWYRNISFC